MAGKVGGGFGVGGDWDLLGMDSDLSARASALAQALRGQQTDALALQALTGGPRAAPAIGQALAQNAQQELGGLGQAAQARMGFDLQRAMQARQQAALENQMRHQQAQEQHQANMEKLYARNLGIRGVKYNPNTGEFINVGGGAPPASAPAPSPVPVDNSAPAPDGAPAPAPKPGLGAPLLGKIADKRLKELGADFDPNSARAGEFGANMKRVNAANRVLALATTPEGGAANLTPQQMTELAQSVGSLISMGGQPSQRITEEMTPYTRGRSWAQTIQWLTDNPKGTDQQGFVQQMIDTAKREQGVAKTAIEQAAAARIGKHQAIIQSNPDQAKALLDRYGYELDPASLRVTPKGASKSAAALSPDDERALAWAKANPNDPRAAKIIQLHGGAR